MINLNTGPSHPYFTVQDHLRTAFRSGIPSLSPSSRHYARLLDETMHTLRELLAVPETHHILICHSVSEIRQRLIADLVREHVCLVGAGAAATDAFATDGRQKKVTNIALAPGEDTTVQLRMRQDRPDVLVYTQNDANTGIALPADSLPDLSNRPSGCLVVADASTAVPYVEYDFSSVNSICFPVWDSLGIPVPVAIWVVDQPCIDRAAGGQADHAFNSLVRMVENTRRDRLYDVFPALTLYLIKAVGKDLITRGIATIRRETEYKAALMYQLLQRHEQLKAVVTDRRFQSKTTLLAAAGEHYNTLVAALEKAGITAAGLPSKSQMCFANYPTHSKEQYERLVDLLEVTPLR